MLSGQLVPRHHNGNARDIQCQTGAEGVRRAVPDWLGQSLLAAEVGNRGEQAPEPRPLAGVPR